MQKVKNNKTVFLCGDMNVDLLKYGSDTNTTHHVDTMFSLGFLINHKLINPSQHWFLKARSCLIDLLCFFVEEITK